MACMLCRAKNGEIALRIYRAVSGALFVMCMILVSLLIMPVPDPSKGRDTRVVLGLVHGST